MMKGTRDKIPEWAQLFLAVLVLAGAMLATYVSNEVRRESMASSISSHETRITSVESSVRDIPIMYERVNQLYQQNERQMIIFERLADSVDKLSVNVARLDERMKALENK